MQTKSMGEEVCKVKCQFRWKIRNQTKHREGKEKLWYSERKKILQDKSEQLKTTIKQANKNGPVGTGINAEDEGRRAQKQGRDLMVNKVHDISKFPREVKSQRMMKVCDEINSSLPRRRGAVVADTAASATMVLCGRGCGQGLSDTAMEKGDCCNGFCNGVSRQ